MPNINETMEVTRKVLPILYVIDTSGSMKGTPIASVNEAMRETVDLLRDISDKNSDAQIKVGALRFSDGVEWVTNGLEYLEDYFWKDLNAVGPTKLGLALEELSRSLSKEVIMKSDTGFCVPVIIFMSDGEPTDDWEKSLELISTHNKWYKYATKIAIAVGDKVDKEILAKVVGSPANVVSVTDIETLKKLIKVVSVTSSMVNSRSRTTVDMNNAEEIIKFAMTDMDKEKVEVGVNNVDLAEEFEEEAEETEGYVFDSEGW